MDQLAILGKAMVHEDADLILGGLPEGYKTVVDQVEGKDTPPSITEVHERLLNHEAKLLSTNAAANNNPFPVSANNVQNRYNNNNITTTLRESLSRISVKCQICNTQGHSARRCPHRNQQLLH